MLHAVCVSLCVSNGFLLTLRLTFTAHAHLDALLVATVLALVPMVLIDGTSTVAAARVRQIAAHRALEERFAA